MKEASILRLKWNKTEKDKINIFVRKAFKQALGLPESTSIERLTHLGMHNTLEGLTEAQLERIASTWTDRI